MNCFVIPVYIYIFFLSLGVYSYYILNLIVDSFSRLLQVSDYEMLFYVYGLTKTQ